MECQRPLKDLSNMHFLSHTTASGAEIEIYMKATLQSVDKLYALVLSFESCRLTKQQMIKWKYILSLILKVNK